MENIGSILHDTYGSQNNNLEGMDAVQTAAARLNEFRGTMQKGMGKWNEVSLNDLKYSIELLSGGTNTVLIDDRGLPSIMVRIPAMSQSDIDRHLPDKLHPVFTAFGKPLKQIFLSKFQNIIVGDCAYSLPFRDPAAKMRFEEAEQACRNKGTGWGLSPYGLRAALQLWARSKGFMPRGNNSYGQDYFYPEEKGVLTEEGRVATGSGPVTWSHDGTVKGVWDLNGNLNEWDAGMRLVDGEMQLEPGCESLFESECETRWQAISPDGTLVKPGSKQTLKYTKMNGALCVASETCSQDESCGCAFSEILAEPGLVIPDIIRAYALYPTEPGGDYGSAWRWVSFLGQNRPLCGGANRVTTHSGTFFMALTYPRGKDYHLSGFRSAYAEF